MPVRNARWTACLVLRGRGRSLVDIARTMNARSHNGVLYAIRSAEKDPVLSEAAREIREGCGL